MSWAAGPGNLAKMRELLDLGDAVPSIEARLRGNETDVPVVECAVLHPVQYAEDDLGKVVRNGSFDCAWASLRFYRRLLEARPSRARYC